MMDFFGRDEKTGNFYGPSSTFYISKDGERLIEKDYIYASNKAGYYGYTNCDENGNHHVLVDYDDAEKARRKFVDNWNNHGKGLEFKTKG